MRKATILLAAVFLTLASNAFAQENEYNLIFPTSEEFTNPFTVGIQSGSRSVSGPFDLDNDGLQEVLVTDYTGGGRVHVIEAQGVDDWQLVYSTPWLDSTATVSNARYATGGDLDGDGNQEIIFISGNSYSATNPNADLTFGLFVFEYTGNDNDFGTLPASINALDDAEIGPPSSGSAEYIEARDIDGDGVQEVLFALNGPSSHDQYYIYSVNGTFEPNGLGTGFETWVSEFRVGPREDGNLYGGGSPILMHTPDLDGDGTPEIAMHVWNNYNFFNADITGADTYVLPDASNENRFYKASPYDNPSLVQATVVDINQDGDDEVFYPMYDGSTPTEEANLNVSLLNYEDGEDVLSITSDNLIYNFLGPLSDLGIASGDIDNDGNMEIWGTGPFGYSATSYNNGIPSSILHLAEFTGGPGGDPEISGNYDITVIDTSSPNDTLGFNVVYRDSLGTTFPKFYRTNGGGIFASKMANLGDADGDGNIEIAFSLQGTDDSLSVIDEVWNADSLRYDATVRETIAIENRIFMRILEFPSNFVVSNEDRPADVPDGFNLSANYPNPFNPSTSFSFTLPRDARVSVHIYDVTGRLIRTLVDNRQYGSGTYQTRWDGTSASGITVASGTYFYSLEHDGTRQVRPMLLVK